MNGSPQLERARTAHRQAMIFCMCGSAVKTPRYTLSRPPGSQTIKRGTDGSTRLGVWLRALYRLHNMGGVAIGAGARAELGDLVPANSRSKPVLGGTEAKRYTRDPPIHRHASSICLQLVVTKRGFTTNVCGQNCMADNIILFVISSSSFLFDYVLI